MGESEKLSRRAVNTLRVGGVGDPPHLNPDDFKTLKAYERATAEWQPDPVEVAKLSYEELLDIPGCGRGMIHEIDKWLSNYGLGVRKGRL